MRVAAALLVLTTSHLARADDGLHAGGHAHFDARYQRLSSATPPAPYEHLIVGGLGIRGFGGLEHLQYALGLDLDFGATHPAGFAYAATIRPVGVALADGDLRLSSTFGALDGVTSRVDPSTRLPLDLWLELPFEGLVKLELALEVAWLPAAPLRQDGTSAIPFADESALQARLRFDDAFERGRFRGANGVYLGFDLGERHGGLLLGATLGYSLDVASRF